MEQKIVCGQNKRITTSRISGQEWIILAMEIYGDLLILGFCVEY